MGGLGTGERERLWASYCLSKDHSRGVYCGTGKRMEGENLSYIWGSDRIAVRRKELERSDKGKIHIVRNAGLRRAKEGQGIQRLAIGRSR